MPDVRAMKLRIPSIVVPRFSSRNFGRRLEMHGDHDGRRLDGHDWEPSKAWCDESDKLFKDGSDCTPKDFEEMMEGMNECDKGDYDGDKDHDDHGHDHDDDHRGHDHDDDHHGHDHDDMGSGYGYGYGFIEEEIVRDIKPECEGVCYPGVCDNADDAEKPECAHCKACHEPAPDRPMDRGDMPHYHDGGMEHSHPGGDMDHDHEDHGDHGDGCGPPMKHKDMKMMSKIMCSPCMKLLDDLNEGMMSPDSKMEDFCAAGGPLDKFKKGCPAKDFDEIMGFMMEGDKMDRRRLQGPPECVSACDEDICCDGGICSDCSISTCSQDDMDMIIGECVRQGSGGGSGSGSGSGGMMMMPKTKAEIDGLYACQCAISSVPATSKGDDYKPTCTDVADFAAAITASDCTSEGLAMMGITTKEGEPVPIAELGTVMAEKEGLSC